MSANRQKWFELLPKDIILLAEALVQRAADERAAGKTIYPAQENIFRALDLTPPGRVKAVIIGQDPYFGPGQANGLAFSVSPGVPIPPSLRNIFKELHDDMGADMPVSGDLTFWAEQGVLLLNTVLTVEEGKPNSHAKWGWQEVVRNICAACAGLPQPIVFMLWGAQARAFIEELQIPIHPNKICLCSSHPSPLGARKGNAAAPAFIGSKPFSHCNAYLQQSGAVPIRWSDSD